MIIAAILLAVCQFAAVFLAVVLVRWQINRVRTEIEDKIGAAVRDLVEQPAPDQPSKLAQLADLIGSCVGSAAARSIMASLNADKSHAARAANDTADVLQSQSNPLLGLLTGGKKGKGAALMRLAQQLGPLLGGIGAPAQGQQLPLSSGSNHGHGPESIADRIKHQGGA